MNRIDSNELDLMVDWMIGHKRFDVEPGGTLTYTFNATEHRMSETGQVLARRALDAWSDVSGILFEHTDDYENSDIQFHEQDLPENSGLARGARIDIDTEVITNSKGNIDSFAFTTFLHEIGHALGIYQPEGYNPENDDPVNSLQTSAISGRIQPDNNHNTDEFVSRTIPQTPQIADILAVQKLYGTPDPVNPGDTVYGVNTNLDSHLGEVLTKMTSNPIVEKSRITFTILDDGGIDTIDFSSDQSAQRVNLNPEWGSNVYAEGGNMIIARGTIIENYIGGSSLDLIIGNDADNILEGRNGDDILEGGPGADTLDGGPGRDTVSYESSSAGVLVRLHDTRAVRFGDAEGDTLIDFEHLTGSAHNDILAGDGGDNILTGGEGDDVLYGGPADSKDRPFGGNHDTLYGGAGDDRLFGGQGNDRLYGGEGNDVLRGGPGQDWLYAEGNHMDVLNGGPGRDVFVFYPSDLGGGTIQDFTDGEDMIKLGKFREFGYESIADLDITPLGENVHIELAGEDYLTMIILSDFDVNNLDESDFSFIA